MRWNVEGASAKTGAEHVITVEADTKEQAEAIARKRGMLVSAVFEPVAHTPAEKLDQLVESGGANDATMARLAAAAQSRPSVKPPDYVDIIRGAAWLRVLGGAVLIFGWLFILGAISCALFAAAVSAHPASTLPAEPLPFIYAAVVCFGYGIFCLVVGAILKMLGSLGSAVRDIARNSFNQ